MARLVVEHNAKYTIYRRASRSQPGRVRPIIEYDDGTIDCYCEACNTGKECWGVKAIKALRGDISIDSISIKAEPREG